jgi:hypothetical protein
VTATTSDNFTVYLPQQFIPSALLRPSHSSISDIEFETELTRQQVRPMLMQHPPQKIAQQVIIQLRQVFPRPLGRCGQVTVAAQVQCLPPFFPWALVPLSRRPFGDLNKPIKGNPSIDFTSSCNKHDEPYTSGASKSFADAAFGRRLSSVCTAAPSNGDTCLAFIDTYVSTVQNYGDSAYVADQQQLACSAWGSSVKKSGCSS